MRPGDQRRAGRFDRRAAVRVGSAYPPTRLRRYGASTEARSFRGEPRWKGGRYVLGSTWRPASWSLYQSVEERSAPWAGISRIRPVVLDNHVQDLIEILAVA